MAKNYTKELQEKIESLEDGFDIKNIEMGLLENELKDILKPNLLISEAERTLLEMIVEVSQYERKNSATVKSKASKDRLLRLIEIIQNLSGMGDKMQSLKLFNRELVGKIQLLRIDRAELKRQIENITKAENF